MSYDIVIGREQQRNLHNARVYFESFAEKYADVVGQRVIDDFNRALDMFKNAHDPIREEETRIFDLKFKHYDAMRRHFGYQTVWSNFDVERLDESLPSKYLDITHVKYDSQLVAVEKRDGALGLDWLAIWKAADKAILESGDRHHVFVEGIYQRNEDPKGVYQIIAGS